MASLPVISAVLSSCCCSSSAATICAIESVLRASAFLCDLQHFRNLLLVLAAVAEAVRPFRPLLDFVFEPNMVGVFAFTPRLPLARVVGEHGFVHHGHAIRNRTYRLANTAAAARDHVGV